MIYWKQCIWKQKNFSELKLCFQLANFNFFVSNIRCVFPIYIMTNSNHVFKRKCFQCMLRLYMEPTPQVPRWNRPHWIRIFLSQVAPEIAYADTILDDSYGRSHHTRETTGNLVNRDVPLLEQFTRVLRTWVWLYIAILIRVQSLKTKSFPDFQTLSLPL